mgnify:CR=1 FL=1
MCQSSRSLAVAVLALTLGALLPRAALGMRQGADTVPPTAAPSATSSPQAVPAHRQANSVAIITVEGVIDRVTLRSIERRLEVARAAGAGAIVFRLNTPGGEAVATLDICRVIKTDSPANTVAWVDPSAYSAGTYIALACREIVMSPNAKFGDAAPIVPGMTLSPTERAKAESPLLSEIVDSARRNSYDERLAMAFVTLSPDLWLLEHVQTGQRVVVDQVEFQAVMGEDPPANAPRPTSPTLTSPPSRPIPFLSRRIGDPPRSTAAAPTKEEIARQIEFEQQRPPVRDALTESDRGQWRLVHQVIPAGQLLTLTTEEAALYGFSVGTIATNDELKAFFGASRVIELHENWSEGLVRFLVHPIVRGVLLVIFIVALFIEIALPGVGIFGLLALIALLVLVGAPALVGLAQWWEVALIMAGLCLIAAEIFVIPGFGVAGIAGFACLLVGIVGTFVGVDLDGGAGRNDILRGLSITVGSFLAGGIVIWFISRRLESLPFMRRFMLTAEIASPSGASIASAGAASAAAATGRVLAPGDAGTAATDLRPSGRGMFQGRLVDVCSTTGWIERGTLIRVVAVDRFEIEVEVAP